MDDTLKLPIEADTALFVANLARAAEALEKLAHANQQSSEKTEKNDKAIEGLGEKLDALKSRTKDGIEIISQWAERINAAVETVAKLADEGDRLTRTQASLGVSLEEAQNNAVGFANETEIATAALTLQERGIRVTQTELNALTRIASSYARTTGKELGEVMENLAETITEGGEELGKFDLALLDVADGSHTAQQRLDAMVQRAREIPGAADSATDSFERLKDEVHDLGVVAAQTFVTEFSHLQEIPSDIRQASDATSDWHDALQETAEVIATIASASVNSIGLIVGLSASGVATVINLGRAGASAVSVLYEQVRAGNLTGAISASGQQFTSAFEANMNSATMQQLLRFTEARSANLTDLLMGGGPQGGSDTGADMVFTLDQARGDARDRAARSRVGSPQRSTRKTLAQLMDAAGGRNGLPFTGESNPDLAVLTDAGQFDEAGQTERDVGKSASQRAADEAAFGQSDDTRLRDRRRDRTTERERREQETRLDQRESFLERWERLNDREIVANDVYAEALQATFEATGQSLATHFEGLAAGRETAAEFFEGLAADTMSALGKEAFGKGAFYTAEALGFAVSGNLASAGTAGAAAGAYFVAGGLLTAGAAALGGEGGSAPSTGGGGGGSPSRPRLASDRGDGGGTNTTTTIIHQYAPTFGGRQGSDAEAGQQVQRYTGAADRRRVQRDRT